MAPTSTRPGVTQVSQQVIFHTAEEACYPYRFCDGVVLAVIAQLDVNEASDETKASELKLRLASCRRAAATASGRQARTGAILVPEFARIVHFTCTPDLCPLVSSWLVSRALPAGLFPAPPRESRILHVAPEDWGVRRSPMRMTPSSCWGAGAAS